MRVALSLSRSKFVIVSAFSGSKRSGKMLWSLLLLVLCCFEDGWVGMTFNSVDHSLESTRRDCG